MEMPEIAGEGDIERVVIAEGVPQAPRSSSKRADVGFADVDALSKLLRHTHSHIVALRTV
jgi:hypothetical protein